MANEEHLSFITQGVDVWNWWRRAHPEKMPDLSDSNLSNMKLRDGDFTRTNLCRADLLDSDLMSSSFNDALLAQTMLIRTKLIGATFNGAILNNANLSYANLNNAKLINVDLSASDLSGANLVDTDLSGANLMHSFASGANFSRANLTEAKLKKAILSGAIFSDSNLTNADFTESELMWTVFANNDLSVVKGLETVRHEGGSTLGIDTIYRSKGNIPVAFLRGVGVPDILLTYLSSLTEQAIQYRSCFLSHAESDGEFADKLRNDLLSNNVRCFHYRYDMRGGKFWRPQVSEAIKINEKLILICSERSLQRRNVVDEIITAMERERETGLQKLFPVRIDDFILSDEMLSITDENTAIGVWREDWVRYVRAYHIPDFRNWKDHDSFQMEFTKLLEALKHPAKRLAGCRQKKTNMKEPT